MKTGAGRGPHSKKVWEKHQGGVTSLEVEKFYISGKGLENKFLSMRSLGIASTYRHEKGGAAANKTHEMSLLG